MNNTFCSAAWTDINIDFAERTIRHCCKSVPDPFPERLTVDFFNNSARIKKTRNDLLNGIQAPDCIQCWEDYKLSGTAYRDIKNTWKTSSIAHFIDSIEIFLDNLCDMSCIYCDELGSSKIASEKKINNKKNLKIDEDLKVFVSFLETVAKKQRYINLSFLGGEVTYSKKFFYFVEQLLKNKTLANSNLTFSMLTNGNSSDVAILKTVALLNKMPDNWSVCVSISNESTNELTELVRHGLSWNRFLRNFEIYLKHEKVRYVKLAPALTIFTVKDFPNLVMTLSEIIINSGVTKRFDILGTWVVNPEILDTVYSKLEYKELIQSLIGYVKSSNVIHNKHEFEHFLNKLKNRIGSSELDHEKLDDFISELVMQKSNESLWNLKNYL